MLDIFKQKCFGFKTIHLTLPEKFAQLLFTAAYISEEQLYTH